MMDKANSDTNWENWAADKPQNTIMGKCKGDWNAAFSKCQVIQMWENEQLSVTTPESAQLHRRQF